MGFSSGTQEKLSQEGKDIVMKNSGKRERSCRQIAKEIFEKDGEVVIRSTIQ